MAMQTGTVDGSLFPDYTITTMKLYEVAKGLLRPALGPSAGNVYVNTKAYESLPADLRSIVDEAAVQSSYVYVTAVKERTGVMMDQAVKQGVQITTLSDADFAKVRKAAEPILDKAAAVTPRSAKLVALIREYLSQKK